MPSRRAVWAGAAALAGCATSRPSAPARGRFITAHPDGFRRGGELHRFAGANMPFAAYLGATQWYGDPDRLKRELDTLAGLGLTNLRVLGGSEDPRGGGSLRATFRGPGPRFDENLLRGLDYLLAEMARRDMQAVIYLTNFWDWSGGMAAYLSWVSDRPALRMNDPAHPWPAFPDFVSAFYSNERAVGLYHGYVRALVGRTNTVTGRRYVDDPTIMSWQLANEPRPGGSDVAAARALPHFHAWIASTAALIKSLDTNHLVSTGSEGLKGCVERPDCVTAAHEPAGVDYVTIHVWPHNWDWMDYKEIPGTYAKGEALVADYIATHAAQARALGKPLVIEEFGYPRDGPDYDPGTPTAWRDRFYRQIYDAVLASARDGGPIAGSNFWSWAGRRDPGAQSLFRPRNLPRDPNELHEPPGWYDVHHADKATLAVVRAHTAALRALPA